MKRSSGTSPKTELGIDGLATVTAPTSVNSADMKEAAMLSTSGMAECSLSIV